VFSGIALPRMFPAGNLPIVPSYEVMGMGALPAATKHAPLMSNLVI
jgi:H+/Cl- antiporter ClcA